MDDGRDDLVESAGLSQIDRQVGVRFPEDAGGTQMKHLGQRWLQIVYALMCVLLWAALAIMPVAGLFGVFNPTSY